MARRGAWRTVVAFLLAFALLAPSEAGAAERNGKGTAKSATAKKPAAGRKASVKGTTPKPTARAKAVKPAASKAKSVAAKGRSATKRAPRGLAKLGAAKPGARLAAKSTGRLRPATLADRRRASRMALAARVRSRIATSPTLSASSAGAGRALLVLENSADAMRDSIVAMARRQIGTPYVLGAESPESGFDCSGLVSYVMKQFDLRLPRTAATQAFVGRGVTRQLDALKPGDLLTFGTGRDASHIGIYVGEGRFVHASTKAGRVIESKLDRPITREIKPWKGARRLVTAANSPDENR